MNGRRRRTSPPQLPNGGPTERGIRLLRESWDDRAMSNNPLMITSDLARAARALTQVSAKVIARNAGLEKQQLRDFEKGNAPLTPEKISICAGPSDSSAWSSSRTTTTAATASVASSTPPRSSAWKPGRRRRHRLRGRHLGRFPHEDEKLPTCQSGTHLGYLYLQRGGAKSAGVWSDGSGQTPA